VSTAGPLMQPEATAPAAMLTTAVNTLNEVRRATRVKRARMARR